MHLHILGICGTFMGGLAALAREAGHRVTGCDAGVYPPMSDQLRALGIDLIEGYGAEQLTLRPDVFVVGNVVSRARAPGAGQPLGSAGPHPSAGAGEPKFPLMEAVLDTGAAYTSGPQWLAEHVLAGRHVLAVAGTHGKTTTTSMLAWVLDQAGLQPGFLVGGVPQNFGVSARLGDAADSRSGPGLGGPDAAPRPFVIEADEYDTAFFDKRSKFVHYRPRTAVLNNLEYDHADIFPDLAAIERQFHHLLRTVPATGRVVSNATDGNLDRVLAAGCWSGLLRFGPGGDVVADGPPEDFAVSVRGQVAGRVRWPLGGLHNQMNALAAIAAAEHAGVPPALACAALCTFQNVKRRMELRGTQRGVAVYDDFAHHPTAIRTTLDGVRRTLPPGGRILAAFEPRSNTMKLGTMSAQLPWALEPADLSFAHTGGLDWDVAAALAPLGTRARCAASVDTLVAQIAGTAQPGDVVVCMSNGGFGGVHERLLAALAA